MAPLTRKQLMNRLGQQTNGNPRPLRMRGANLHDFDFSNLDLTGANLSFSNLRSANFQHTILRDADLSFANLRKANFDNADLRGANLNFCQLSGASLTDANIEGVSMSFSSACGLAKKAGGKPLPAEPLTLTTLLQKPVWGSLIGVILAALLVYGCAGIIHFTNLIVTATDPFMAQYNNYILLQNLTSGVMVFLLTRDLAGWLIRQFRRVWMRHLLLSVAILIGFLSVNASLYFWLGKGLILQLVQRGEAAPKSAPAYAYALVNLLIANVFLYVMQQGRQLTRKLSEQEYQLLNMEKLKTRAELDALQAKINPHFLYNALNSIASLVHEDPAKAEEMTLLLSRLFRYTTGRAGEVFTSLADELEMVRTYLQVEQVRFGARLTFGVMLTDPTLNTLRIPQFLLQPIVENSVKHGISKSAEAGRIDVKIIEKEDWLYLSVHDSGPVFPDAMDAGYGLRSIQDKLKLIYGDDARVELNNQPYKQVLIALRLSRLRKPTDTLAANSL